MSLRELVRLTPLAGVKKQIAGMFEGYVDEWPSFPVGIVSAYLTSSPGTRPAGQAKDHHER